SYPPPPNLVLFALRSKRGAHFNHPRPASITTGLMGQFKLGAQRLPREGRKRQSGARRARLNLPCLSLF
ncbi:hypothetical protein BGY98DRAFT_1006722, partial [Russula aff. rugulosa BPL654]